jgi:TIR domain
MPEAEGGGIFVSYRREESAHLAGRLYDRLADRFGEGQVFIDVDAIEPGVDFAEEISRAVAVCKVLLAVIGPTWLTATDRQGRRRLVDPDDIVRLEIEAALARDVRVIPILVEGAVMPGREDLPESLAGLARRNALLIRHESFRYDAGRLLAAIERVLAAVPGAAAVPRAAEARDGRPAGNTISEVAQQGPGPARHDPTPAVAPGDTGPKGGGTREPWNGHDWYVSFGEYDEGRNWDDARKYGFVSAGGLPWYSKTLRSLPAGARIFAYIPQAGYVGVGTTTGEATPFDDALVTIDGEQQKLSDQLLVGNYHHPPVGGEDTAEYVAPVEWITTRPRELAVHKKGLFANQNSACKLRNRFTLNTLYTEFGLEDREL